jgi:hypothetical protein
VRTSSADDFVTSTKAFVCGGARIGIEAPQGAMSPSDKVSAETLALRAKMKSGQDWQ